ncbi:hypothetical protein AB9K26_09315 [Psychroserpens sp. XS_ASV72]|uniref:hypothetical protein n=1 Tax=Psychroserpens sp. XS_ASV72 TaxID=3241293 RepID=UPI003517D3AB
MKRFCLFFLISSSLFSQNIDQSDSNVNKNKIDENTFKLNAFEINYEDLNTFSEEEEGKRQNLFSTPTNGPNQFHIDFVGTANLQQNINEANEDLQGSAGLGVIFERYFLKWTNDEDSDYRILKEGYENRLVESLDMEAYINVASSIDSLTAEVDSGQVTNQRLFGSYLLNPVSTKQSIFINTNVFFNYYKPGWFTKIVSGANVRVNASNMLWNINDGTNNISRYAGAISFRAGIFHEFLPNNKIRDEKNKRKYSVRLGLHYSSRHITGDISSKSNDLLREQILGTKNKNFSGFEPSFGFRLNNIIAEFTMPSIRGSSRSDIEGLTDTQFMFSIRFVGGFSLAINGNDSNNDEDEDDN